MSSLAIAGRGPDRITLKSRSPRLSMLQVTDLHVGFNGKEACKEIARLVDLFHVDLVIVTGDFFCKHAAFIIDKQLEYMERYVGSRCPWTFAWGNHDLENITLDGKTLDRGMLDAIETTLASLPGCLHVPTRAFMESYPRGVGPAVDPRERRAWGPAFDPAVPVDRFDGHYGGNFLLEVSGPGGERPALHLLILNSRRWHHLPPKVLAWMRDVAREHDPGVPAMCFYHVPTIEFQEIWERGIAAGFKREDVCSEQDDGRIHAFLRDEVGTVMACFAGHDHVNDYHGTVDGIRYEYGRKTGQGGYGSMVTEPLLGMKGVRTGAKLVRVDLASSGCSLDVASVFNDGTTWRPASRVPRQEKK